MGMSRNFDSHSQSAANNKELNNRNDQYLDETTDDDYEEGDVNGYMVQRPLGMNNGMAVNVS